MTITGEFGELNEEFNKLTSDVNISLENVTDFQTSWNKLTSLFKTTEEFVGRLQLLKERSSDSSTINRTVDIFYRRALEDAKITLKQFVTDAANSSQEFGRPLLREPLIRACDSGGIVTIQLTKNGWNSSIKATANLDEVMGSLEQWAQAVDKVRAENDWYATTDPIKASAMWRDSIFLGHIRQGRKSYSKGAGGGSLWSDTIMERLAMAGMPAPYWKLLNNSQMTSMSSDRQGIPYPYEKPTFFKERAEEQIEADFKNDILSARSTWEIAVQKIDSMLEQTNNLLKSLKNEINRLEGESLWDPGFVDLPIRKVITSLNLDEEKINYDKLLRAVNELVSIGDLITVRVTKDQRIEITAKGGPRKRISYRKLRTFLGV